MTTIPKTAKQPADHTKPAVQIEAERDQTADVQWRGLTFTVPADPDDWTVETTLAFEDGHAANGVRLMIGPDQWKELMATKPRNRDLGDLFDTIAKTLGLGDSSD